MNLGNTNLIYSIIRSKAVFYQLANLPEDSYQLMKPGTEATAGSEAREGEVVAHTTENVQETPKSMCSVICGTLL